MKIFQWRPVLGVAVAAVLAGTLQAQTVSYTVLAGFPASQTDSGFVGYPQGLIQASDGNFYGSTYYGGPVYDGTLFQMTPQGQLKTIHGFTGGADGIHPGTRLIESNEDTLYGSSQSNDSKSGARLFKVTMSGSAFQVIYTFPEGVSTAGIIRGSDGNFYGVTNAGGENSLGSIYKVNSIGALTTLYSFTGGNDGSAPAGMLIQSSDGAFYGVTPLGGQYNGGTIFKISSAGAFQTVYSFGYLKNADKGATRPDGLVEGSDGNFYGTTETCYGSSTTGMYFRLTPAGVLTRLVNLNQYNQGSDTEAPYTPASDGNFYVTAGAQGNEGEGELYQLNPNGTAQFEWGFSSVDPGGDQPASSPIQGSDGALYGTTTTDCCDTDEGNGTIYRFVPSTPLAPPIQLSFPAASIELGQSTTLSWKVLNGFSTTGRQCYAYAAKGAGTWSGRQNGAYANAVFSGSATIAPTAAGSYTYAMTCGGVMSGFAQLMVRAAD